MRCRAFRERFRSKNRGGSRGRVQGVRPPCKTKLCAPLLKKILDSLRLIFLALRYCKNQIDGNFLRVSPVIDHEFHHNIVKVVCGSTRLRRMIKTEDRRPKPLWSKAKTLWPETQTHWSKTKTYWSKTKTYWSKTKTYWSKTKTYWSKTKTYWSKTKTYWSKTKTYWSKTKTYWSKTKTYWSKTKTYWSIRRPIHGSTTNGHGKNTGIPPCMQVLVPVQGRFVFQF